MAPIRRGLAICIVAGVSVATGALSTGSAQAETAAHRVAHRIIQREPKECLVIRASVRKYGYLHAEENWVRHDYGHHRHPNGVAVFAELNAQCAARLER